MNRIKYKTGRHKNGETGSYHYIPPFYVIEIVMVVQFYFSVLSLSLSLSSSLSLSYVYMFYLSLISYMQQHPATSSLIKHYFVSLRSFQHTFGMIQVFATKSDFYSYITFYGYGYNIQHSLFNIFWNFFLSINFGICSRSWIVPKCNFINSNAIPFV